VTAVGAEGLVNLAHMIDAHAGDRVALIVGGRETTYGELRDHVARLRGGLAAHGVGSGDRVALLCGNNRYFVIGYLAIVGLGAVAVPLNPSSPAPEIERELAKVTPVAVIVGPVAAPAWNDVDRSALPSVRVVVAAEGELDGAIGLDELLASEPHDTVDVASDHLAVMMFTSGTAGPPRAAMLSHGNLLANIEQSMSVPDRTSGDDVVYGVLPLFHIFGLNVVLGVSFTMGATVLLVQRFDPATAAESVRERAITVLPGAPSMWVAFAHFDELAADTFRSVRIALSGASKLPVAIAEKVEERFGVRIAEGYGLTEAAPVVTSSAGGLEPRYGSVGKALPGVEVRLVAENGVDALVGDVGEIWVRGDNVFQGYWREPEVTARVLDSDGWLHTGDLATTDDDGWLYLVDRAKDLVIVSGFNVFPAEVEAVLAAHPAVAEVGVIGVPHPHTGEAVKAFVVVAEGTTVDEDALIDHCCEYLARYKAPSKIVFVDELPRNTSGKLLRRDLASLVVS
jgi:long-chain acyl-CoA synthetase